MTGICDKAWEDETPGDLYQGLAGNSTVLWLLGFRIQKNILSLVLANDLPQIHVLRCGPEPPGGDQHRALFIRALPHLVPMSPPLERVCCGLRWALGLATLLESLCFLLLTCVMGVSSLTLQLRVQCSSRHRRPRRLYLLVLLRGLLMGVKVFMAVLELYFEIYIGNTYKTWRYIISISSCILNFLVFMPLMVLSSLILFVKSWKRSRHHHPAKLHITILVTILVFLFFGFPQKVWFVVHFGFKVAVRRSVSMIFELLSCINSSANPAIYFFVGNLWKNKKRRSLKLTLLRAFKEDFQGRGDRRTLPATISETIERKHPKK
ncbi:proto-oncogene Mas-like [Antechinus flavipes]|uniref:proto-oncogene Mas-like n=1 Tax=Antechinus flavipes TaxID=38775 RepID=UPI002236050E|nr:proto-oncogene Mas-like [Antechinus flavipes]